MKRLECLDGLRGVLALYVLLSHVAPFAVLPGWLARAMSHGGAGVDMFFMLSGLVIVRSLESFGYRAGPFLIARTARIFPVFLPVFALAIVVQPLDPGFARMSWITPGSLAWRFWAGDWPADWRVAIATHLTMTHGMLPNGISASAWLRFLTTAWSLSTEWQFYVLVTVLGVGFGGTRGLRRLAGLLLAIAVLGQAWNALTPDPWCFSRAFLPNKAQYFALGVASAVLVRDAACRRHFLLVLAATLLLSLADGGGDKLLPPLAWTLCLAAQLRPELALLGLLSRMLRSPPMRWLGAVSYCLYLVHEPLQKLLGIALGYFAGGNATLFTAIWLPGAVLLPLLAAWWLHASIEVPALRYGRRVARRGLDAPRPLAVRIDG